MPGRDFDQAAADELKQLTEDFREVTFPALRTKKWPRYARLKELQKMAVEARKAERERKQALRDSFIRAIRHGMPADNPGLFNLPAEEQHKILNGWKHKCAPGCSFWKKPKRRRIKRVQVDVVEPRLKQLGPRVLDDNDIIYKRQMRKD